jgi:pyruvate/2-oxoglutarate dehydrogenase complex dihydrolipoamide acyltransferase (E2) component
MAVDVILPKIGFAMTEATVAEWLVPDGMSVVEGQPLFTLESDKSATEIESPGTGVLHVVKPAGETYEVGTILGWIE